jgi:glycosyltransferase involved in cell wall biosynthesis
MSADSLRILLTADPDLPVPPRLYGGIERVIALLADGLSARGHDVTLVAHRDSRIAGRLVPYPSVTGRLGAIRNTLAISRAVARVRPDVVHSFGRLATLGPVLASRIPKLMSYQREVTPRSVEWGRRLAGSGLTFVACSHRLIAAVPDPSAWRVAYNAVDVARYPYAASVADDAPLVFLGRIERVKGAHVAIAVARQAGRRLIIAGNVPAGQEPYFDEHIKPHVDGSRVVYAGPVDDTAKGALLSSAAALLMPVLWEEPFGIVMAEALACGTPVIGFRRGAVPEVVQDAVTGVLCGTEEGMRTAIGEIPRLSREACRRDAESRFSQRALVETYLGLYHEAIERARVRVSTPGAAPLAARRDS